MKIHDKKIVQIELNQQLPKIAESNISRQYGVGLVELMVTLVIGLVVSLAIYGVLTASEGRKRTTNSINDIDQVGAYTLYQLDKNIRSAGSGFSAGSTPLGSGQIVLAATYAYGCPLRVARAGAQVLPPTSFSAPFAAVPTTVRLVPAVIINGAAPAGDDVIITMSGSAGLGESGTKFSAPATNTNLSLANHAGFRALDIALLTSPPSGGNMSPCLTEHVSSAFIPTAGAANVPLAGDFYQATVAGTSITSYLESSIALNLGQSPVFSMFAVGTNDTLLRYDLLRAPDASTGSTDPNPAAFADSVYQMHAIYGVDTDGDPTVASVTWVAPTGAYSSATLLSGTAAANTALTTIRAIKIGLVMRSTLPERVNVSAATATLFASTTVPVTVNLAPLNFRYRVFEATIPLRNPIMLP
ncbi:MAG TPA: PilW family protein [Methylophilaceae bacterium]|nr:PilW family protein [Methylophilaceae bacterium]